MDYALPTGEMPAGSGAVTCTGNCFRNQAPGDLEKHLKRKRQGSEQRAESLPSFVYKPIHAWEIRILELHAGDQDESLQGTLFTATLAVRAGSQCAIKYNHESSQSEAVDFEALSYSWLTDAEAGSTSVNQTETLLVEGTSIPVTSNLSAALKSLRHLLHHRYLWVDALCINQGDTAERSQQVSNMLQIYQTAQSVQVWLGESTPTSTEAIQFLLEKTSSLVAMTHISHSDGCLASSVSLLLALADVYGRRWLTRTWVRQEIYAARLITVLCGRDELDWDSFLAGTHILQYLAQALKTSPSLDDKVSRLRHPMYRQRFEDLRDSTTPSAQAVKPFRDLVDVLLLGRAFEVTVHHDFVYATLGMCGIPVSAREDGAQALQNVNTDNEVEMQGLRRQADRGARSRHRVHVDYDSTMQDIWYDVSRHLLLMVKDSSSSDRASYSSFAKVFNLHWKPPSKDVLEPQKASWVVSWREVTEVDDIDFLKSAEAHMFIPKPKEVVPNHRFVRDILYLTAWAWDIVVDVGDYTYNIGDFAKHDYGPMSWDHTYETGYYRGQYEDWRIPPGYQNFKPGKDQRRPYEPSKHCRRLASTLAWSPSPAVQDNHARNLVLVPSAARAGGIVVLVAQDAFPIVVRATDSHGMSFAKHVDSLRVLYRHELDNLLETEPSGPDVFEPEIKIRQHITQFLLSRQQGFEFIGPALAHWRHDETVERDYMGTSLAESVGLRFT